MIAAGRCPACGAAGAPAPPHCPRGFPLPVVGAGAQWLDAPPDARWPDGDDDPNPFVRFRPFLWSYRRARDAGWSDADFVGLVRRLDAEVAAVDGHGFSARPCTDEPALAAAVGVGRLRVQDETGNVGGSHKARHLFGLLLHLAVDAETAPAGSAAATRLAIASCGNAALGAATVARAAGRPLDVFIPTWADPAVVARLEALDATIHVCVRRDGEAGDPCIWRFREAVAEGALPFGVQAAENGWALDGGRTLGFELAASMGDEVADLVLIQVGGGGLLASTAMGLLTARAHGAVADVPQVWATQAAGCAPLDRAWRRFVQLPGDVDARLCAAARHAPDLMWPWDEPTSAATGILDDVTYDWLGCAQALARTGGGSVVAPEAEVLAANELAARHTAIDADHTGTAGLAGLLQLVAEGRVAPTASAVVLFTGVRRSGVRSAG